MCFHPPSDVISPKMIIFCGFELEKSNWVKHKYANFEPFFKQFQILVENNYFCDQK